MAVEIEMIVERAYCAQRFRRFDKRRKVLRADARERVDADVELFERRIVLQRVDQFPDRIVVEATALEAQRTNHVVARHEMRERINLRDQVNGECEMNLLVLKKYLFRYSQRNRAIFKVTD